MSICTTRPKEVAADLCWDVLANELDLVSGHPLAGQLCHLLVKPAQQD